MKKAIKPKVYSLGSCGYDLVYKCGKCDYHFSMAHDGFDYCPHCGNRIDWGVVITVNEEWKKEYLASIEPYFDENGNWHREHPRAQFMREQIDYYNQNITDGQRYQMEQTQATKEAIICSNISYYVNQGWTREELITKGFFTEDDFKVYEAKNEATSNNK